MNGYGIKGIWFIELNLFKWIIKMVSKRDLL